MFNKSPKYINHWVSSSILSIMLILSVSILTLKILILSAAVCHTHSPGYFTVKNGDTINTVASELASRNCISRGVLFTLAVKLTRNEKNLKPGRYSLANISRMDQLVSLLTSSPVENVKTTIYEGYTIQQVATVIARDLDMDEDRFIQLCGDEKFIQSLDIQAPTLEGYLFPDTYHFFITDTEEDIIRIMVGNFKKKLKLVLDSGVSGPFMSEKEIIILASIIQGEAQDVAEMPLISSVYHNRLENNMMLQADPTIQYILPARKEKLYNKDLKIDSPYNTYLYRGLPPGAINNPGLSALKAAAYPQSTDYLYFVADGNGSHIFSRTVKEHNNAKLKIKKKAKNNQS